MQRQKMNVSACAAGTKGWEFICQVPGRPGIGQFYDKLGVQGGAFGIAMSVDGHATKRRQPTWQQRVSRGARPTECLA